jgi:hypothetical protein
LSRSGQILPSFLCSFSVTFALFAISMEISFIFQTQKGQTALIIATCGGHKDVVRVLVERGANVESADEVRDMVLFICGRLTW